MDFFTVVKKALYDERDANEVVKILLRLIIDNRRGNQTWRTPPWTAMAGPGALSSLSFRKGIEEGAVFDGSCGDLPHFFLQSVKF